MDLFEIFGILLDLLQMVIVTIFVIATVVFLWGIIVYLTAGGNEEKIKEGRRFIIWGIVFLAVMVAMWGLVWALTSTFGLGGEPIPFGPGLGDWSLFDFDINFDF